jgi:nickel transport protein
MRIKWRVIASLTGILVLGLALPVKVFAHGASIEYEVSTVIELVATYDSGEPMAGAQFVVYAPDDPATPWLTGVCDDEGRFSFAPDSSRPGTWDVQVRQAGHGDIVHIPVGGDAVAAGGGGGYSKLQIGLMSAAVVWGSVGTALYFSRKRKA